MSGPYVAAFLIKGSYGELTPHPACGATFSLRAKSRLRRLRSDTRLRAQAPSGKA